MSYKNNLSIYILLFLVPETFFRHATIKVSFLHVKLKQITYVEQEKMI